MPVPVATLSLHELAELVPLAVVRPAQIATLGFLPDRLEQMLSFLDGRMHLGPLSSNPCVVAVITSRQLADLVPPHIGLALAAEPRRSFFELQNALAERTDFYGAPAESSVHETASIHPRAGLSGNGVRIGAGVRVESGAVIGPGTALGEKVVVRVGAVLGASGFQTYRGGAEFIEMTHAGALEIGDGTVIFSNAVVARGVFRQTTRIGRQCRIGVSAFVSHNVEMGDFSFVGHGAVVNGNCRIGRNVWIGPGAVLAHGIEVRDRAEISPGAVVVGDVESGEHVSGNFAVGHQRLLRHLAKMREKT